MSAYWVARVKVKNQEAYQAYMQRAPQAFSKYGATLLARGEGNYCLEGDSDFTRSVVIKFPSVEQAVACHQSEEYQNAARYRQDVAIVDAWVVEGL